MNVLLEEVYLKSASMGLWNIARHASGLLRKSVSSLTSNIADILVQQKHISIGFRDKEQFISSPVSPAVLEELIYASCDSDVREASMVQEILTYLGSFIRGEPNILDGILRVRTHYMIMAMLDEIARMKRLLATWAIGKPKNEPVGSLEGTQ